MEWETRGQSLFFRAYEHVARWIAQDVEARKRKRADVFRRSKLVNAALVTWKGNTDFMPALESSSEDDVSWSIRTPVVTMFHRT